MDTQLEELIKGALNKAKEEPPGREIALVKTKLQEALFWCAEYRSEMRKILNKHMPQNSTPPPIVP